MKSPFGLHSYPARLVLGAFVLILLTTLSAGVPAYWLTRSESDRQAWSHVISAQQATRSLLHAEQDRLDSLVTLFAERPTLRRLLDEADQTDLLPYLQDFQGQSDLDILFLCRLDDPLTLQTASIPACLQPVQSGFQWIQSRPAMLASQQVTDPAAPNSSTVAVVGRWLDDDFMRELATNTGVAQSVVLPDGTRLASSVVGSLAAWEEPPAEDGRRLLTLAGQPYYAVYLPLGTSDDPAGFTMEIALPVDSLLTTQYRALTLLILSTGGMALLGMVLGIWFVRRLTNPLEQLTRSAEAISAGDLTALIPAPLGPSEVRTLATALQHSQASMLTALDDLAQARDWLDNLFQSIVEGVVTFDQAGNVTFINEKAADLASRSAQEAVGRYVEDLFFLSDESGNRVFLQRLPLRGRHRLTLNRRVDGVVQPPLVPGQHVARRLGGGPPTVSNPLAVLEVTATHLSAANGQALQTALILRNITQEESLHHLRAYFLANITHEFRTPLSTLNASMELLTTEADLSAGEMRELLKPIHLSLVSLQTLIDNLLESSSIEAGRFVIRRQAVDLSDVIAAAIRVVQPLMERRQQALALTEPAFLPPLTGDPARLTQALVNLLSNASKYSPVNTAIDLTVELSHAWLRLAVADQGPGIPPVERENLFRRFVRMDVTNAEQYGVGLGLFVVKTTVEAHGGRVGVDEHVGGGSVFWIDLPFDIKTEKNLGAP